jgi:hypothetical protein
MQEASFGLNIGCQCFNQVWLWAKSRKAIKDLEYGSLEIKDHDKEKEKTI